LSSLPRSLQRAGYTETKAALATIAAVSYVVVEDIAASWEQYDQFAAALAGATPAGLILHAAGPTDEGFRIVEVWETEEAWLGFAGHESSADGMSGPPQVFRALRPAHVIYGKQPGREGS
jgi:hypothetical protein